MTNRFLSQGHDLENTSTYVFILGSVCFGKSIYLYNTPEFQLDCQICSFSSALSSPRVILGWLEIMLRGALFTILLGVVACSCNPATGRLELVGWLEVGVPAGRCSMSIGCPH